MAEAATIPGLQDLESITPMLREFGATTTVLFIILLAGLAGMWYFIWRYGKKLDDINDKLSAYKTELELMKLIVTNAAKDIDIVANTCKTLTDQGCAQAEKLRDMFTYFINQKGRENGDRNGTK